MNRRIPRLALLVVLFVSMLGVFQLGGSSPTDLVLAQGSSCGPWKPYEETAGAQSESTPEAEDPDPENTGYEVNRISTISERSNSNVNVPLTLTEITLFPEGTFAAVSDESSIVRIDSGAVKLTVCEGSTVGISLGDSDGVELVGAGEYPLTEHSVIYIDPEDGYYLTDDSGNAAATQQLDFELSNNANALQPRGAGLSVISMKPTIVCGGTRC